MTCKIQTLQYNRLNTMEAKWNLNKKIKLCVCVVVVVQLLSHVRLLVTPWTAACQASLSFTVSQNLLKLTSIESMMPYNISSSVTPFSSCLQSFPASGSFPVSWLFASGGQSIEASAPALVLPMNSHCMYVTHFFWSIHMFMDSWVPSIFWLL